MRAFLRGLLRIIRRGLAAEDAASGIFVMQLGAHDAVRASGPDIDLGSGQHADQWGREINPYCNSVVCGNG
jgi:hypothetical protein